MRRGGRLLIREIREILLCIFYSCAAGRINPRQFIAVAQRDKVMTCRKCNLPNKTRLVASDRNIVAAATWSPSASGIDCQLPVERRRLDSAI